jgi:hypothetical protein
MAFSNGQNDISARVSPATFDFVSYIRWNSRWNSVSGRKGCSHGRLTLVVWLCCRSQTCSDIDLLKEAALSFPFTEVPFKVSSVEIFEIEP